MKNRTTGKRRGVCCLKICKVIGVVAAQQKEASLVGKKLLLCEPKNNSRADRLVAVDLVGAGVGHEVLVTEYSGSCEIDGRRLAHIDACVVALIDEVVIPKNEHKKEEK
jgi:ethanolamine utilization protein EutN